MLPIDEEESEKFEFAETPRLPKKKSLLSSSKKLISSNDLLRESGNDFEVHSELAKK